MKTYFYIIFFCFLSCSTQNEKNHILSSKDFESLIIDIHILEAELYFDNKNDSTKLNLNAEYASIYNKYEINDSIFQLNIEYYSKDPKILSEIYDSILKKIDADILHVN